MRKIIKKLRFIVALSLGILFTLLIFANLILIPLTNNYRLHKQEKSLVMIDLPKDTLLIEKQSVCGKLNGNGNGMNYLATILIRSELSLKELQEYYSDYGVIEQNSSHLECEYLEHDSISYLRLENIKNFRGYYAVYSYQSAEFGSFLEWDIRGH